MTISTTEHVPINGVVPGVRGQRAFPSQALSNADPFLMLDHIGPQAIDVDRTISGTPHPHRGFETVSIFLAGRMDHVDSLGNRIPIEAGDIQVMNAGRGIIHGGNMYPDPDSGLFHEFQLWVNVPATKKMVEPTVTTVTAASIPCVGADGVSTRVLTGTAFGITSPGNTTAPTLIAHVTATAGARWHRPEERPGQTARLYVIAGSLAIDDVVVHGYQTATIDGHPAATCVAGEEGAQWLWLTGEPLREPVVMGGPFVMNTREEIEAAQADYRAGLFGRLA